MIRLWLGYDDLAGELEPIKMNKKPFSQAFC